MKIEVHPDTSRYQTVRTATGGLTKICGDDISLALVGATLTEAYDFVASVVSLPREELVGRYCMLNVGQQRMCLGNLIRGAINGKDQAKKERIQTAFNELKGPFMSMTAANIDKILKQKELDKQSAKAEREERRFKKVNYVPNNCK